MDSRTTVGSRCTIQVQSGRFCDLPAARQLRYPVCGKHARHLVADVVAAYDGEMANPLRRISIALGMGSDPDLDLDPEKPSTDAEQVYYLLIDGTVKIGFTGNLDKRLTQYPPTAQLLATEPGGRVVEAQRLEEFREYRTARREWFAPGPRLRAHIEALPSYSAAA